MNTKEVPFENIVYRLVLHEFEDGMTTGLIPDHQYFSSNILTSASGN